MTRTDPPDLNAEIANVVKQKHKRPGRTELYTPHCNPGEISEWLSQAVTMADWPPVDTNAGDQVANRIKQYHQYCIEHDIKPDMSGMALALGTTRQTLWRWENGVESNKPQAVRDAIKKGRQTNEFLLVQMMNNGKINPIPAIFLLKNNHGYKDVQDVVVTPNTPLQNMDSDAARANIIEALPDNITGNIEAPTEE